MARISNAAECRAFLEDNFLEDKKVRAALGESRPRAYRSGDGVGGDVTGRVAPKLVF